MLSHNFFYFFVYYININIIYWTVIKQNDKL